MTTITKHPGDHVYVRVNVRNTGSGRGSWTVRWSISGLSLDGSWSVSLSPGQSKTLTSSAYLGNSLVGRSGRFKVSWSGSTSGSHTTNYYLQVKSAGYPRISLSNSFIQHYGGSYPYFRAGVTIKNVGTARGSWSVYPQLENSSTIRLGSATYTLNPGESKTYYFVAKAPNHYRGRLIIYYHGSQSGYWRTNNWVSY